MGLQVVFDHIFFYKGNHLQVDKTLVNLTLGLRRQKCRNITNELNIYYKAANLFDWSVLMYHLRQLLLKLFLHLSCLSDPLQM